MATVISIVLGGSLGIMLAIALLQVFHWSHLDESSVKFFRELEEHV
jgi:hypothetical protein